MNAVILQHNDFERLITEIKNQVKEEFKNMKGVVVEEPMCLKEAARYLKIDLSTLHRRIASGKLPIELVHSNGGQKYFFASELYQYIKKS